MTDSIKVNTDVKMATRYALGYTPEEEPYSVDPSTFCWTVGLEKGIRGGISIFPDMKNPKNAWQQQKALEQSYKGSTFGETYKNYRRGMEIQELEKRFRPLSANQLKDLKKLEDFENIKKLSTEAKSLTGRARKAKMHEVKNALLDFQRSQGYSNVREAADEIKKLKVQKPTTLKKQLIDLRKTQHYDKVRQLVDEAKGLKGKDYTNKMKEVQKAIADANLKVHKEVTNGTLKAVTKRGKLWNGVKNVSGYNKTKEVVETTLTKSSKLRGVSKFARSNAITAVSIDLALSIPEIIETKNTFNQVDENGNSILDENGNVKKGCSQKGTEKALKQAGRAIAITGTQVAAYAIGAEIGTAACAALWAAKGAALGSVAPGIGTAIGAVVGLAAGLILSHYAGKVAQNVFGKSELDQLHDKVANNLTTQAQQNDEILAEVVEIANERLASEDKDSENAKKIKTAFNNISTAYDNGQIGTASVSAETPKKDLTAKAETPKEKKKTNTTTAKSQTEAKENNIEDKYKNTLAKLDYYIDSLDSMTYSGYNPTNNFNNFDMSNMQMFNSPFMNYDINEWGMYA